MEKGRTESYDNRQGPVALYFESPLRWAIEVGSEIAIRDALEGQPLNDVTEAISNHLIVRSFMAEQKGKLVALDASFSEATTLHRVVKLVGEYTDGLADDFERTFIASEAEGKFSKLTGDALFRKALAAQSVRLPAIARHIAALDAGSLASPEELLCDMESTQDSIAEYLWGSVAMLRLKGVNFLTLKAARGVIYDEIDTLDKRLLEGFG